MKQQLKLQDALEILKEKTATADLEEMEVIFDLALRMNVLCQKNGTKRQITEVNDLYRDILLQRIKMRCQCIIA